MTVEIPEHLKNAARMICLEAMEIQAQGSSPAFMSREARVALLWDKLGRFMVDGEHNDDELLSYAAEGLLLVVDMINCEEVTDG